MRLLCAIEQFGCPHILVHSPIVKTILEWQHTCIGHINLKRLTCCRLLAILLNSSYGIGVIAIIGNVVAELNLVNWFCCYLLAIAVYIESNNRIGSSSTCCNTRCRTHLIGTDEDIVDKQHKGIVRHTVDSYILSFLRNGILNKCPFGRQLNVWFVAYKLKVGRTFARCRIAYTHTLRTNCSVCLIAACPETNLEVGIKRQFR